LKTKDNIPDFEEIMLPLLEYGKKGNVCSIIDLEKHLAKKFNLSMKERRREKPSGREPTFLNRILWSRLYLKKAGLIFDPEKAHFQITDNGIALLKKNPKKLNTKLLMEISEFKRWKDKIKAAQKRARKKKIVKKYHKSYGLIVLIDALGTKGIWKRNESEDILKKWTQFIKNIRDSVVTGLSNLSQVSFASFSDTIVITVDSDNIEDTLRKTSELLSSHIIESMLIDMPIRGCMSVGEFYRGEQLIIGPAIDEAAEYYTLPQWIGISASPSAHLLIERMYKRDPIGTSSFFQKFTIPLNKSVEQNAWAMNWVDIADQFVKDNSEIISGKKYDQIPDAIYENLEKYSDVGVSLKWRNTLKFYEDVNEKTGSS
jgi:hypothetical protein